MFHTVHFGGAIMDRKSIGWAMIIVPVISAIIAMTSCPASKGCKAIMGLWIIGLLVFIIGCYLVMHKKDDAQ